MASNYYKPCKELDMCNELIEKYWDAKKFRKCFKGHLKIAKTGYPLAECQVGYFYLEGIGVRKNIKKAFIWTELSANHGDLDAQYNLGCMYESGTGVEIDIEKAKYWFQKSALQNSDLAIKKCLEYNIHLPKTTEKEE